jgi:hypothetical protein
MTGPQVAVVEVRQEKGRRDDADHDVRSGDGPKNNREKRADGPAEADHATRR